MKKSEGVKKRFLLNVLLVSVVIVGTMACLGMEKSEVKVKEEKSVADVYSDEKNKKHSLKAVLYNNNKYASGGSGVSLSASGATVSGWVEGATKYLQIDATLHEYNKKGHTIRVELPKEFYVVGDVNYKPTGVSEVKFSKNADISINNGGTTYNVNDKSGTLTYYISPSIGQLTIQLAIGYDERFWDKQSNSAITASGVAPITVSMNFEENPGTYVSKGELAKVKVGKVTSGTGTSRYGFYPMYSYMYDLSKTNTKNCCIEVLESTQKLETTYLKEGYIELSIPYYTHGGKKYYLSYSYNTVEWVKEFFHGGMNIEVVETSESKIKIKVQNLMFNTRDMVVLPLTYPSALKVSSKYVTFTNGNLKIYGTSNNGSSVTLFNEAMPGFEYATAPAEDMIYHVYDNTLHYYTGRDAVSFLGGIYLENKGTVKSGNKTITYSFPKELLVTTINLPVGKDNEKLNIEYSLYDENNNTVKIDGKTSWTITVNNDTYPYPDWVHNTFTTFKRSQLPDAHKNYYFKTVKYDTSGFAPDSRIFMYQAEYNVGGTGNVYGYQSKNMKPNSKYTIDFKMKATNGTEMNVKINKSISATKTVSLGIDSAKFDVSKTFAGSDVNLEGSLFVIDYPYANSFKIDVARIGLLLPSDVSFTKESVQLTLQNGKTLGVNTVTSKNVSGGNKFWIIEANRLIVGYLSEDLKAVTNGSRVNFKIKLSTDANMKLTTLSTHTILYGANLNSANNSYGNYAWASATDLYDLNGNGSTSDKVAISNVANSVNCVIEPGKANIELNDSITVTGSGSVSGKNANLKAASDIINYKMQLKSVADNYATGLEYYIPIPKSNSAIDTKLVTGQSGNLFDLSLQGEAIESGSAIKSIEYLVKSGVNYTEAAELGDSNWYTAAELSNNDYNFANVTMIKVVLKDGSMTNGMTSTLQLKLKMDTWNISSILKHKDEWKCSGYYTFKRDGINVGGWISSDGVSAYVAEGAAANSPVVSPESETNGKKIYYVYENEEKVLHKDKIEFMVETDYEETRLTFKLIDKNAGTVSPSNFTLYRGNSKVSPSGSSFTIYPNTTYRIEFKDDYLYNMKCGGTSYELNTLVEYWLWEGKWEYEWELDTVWYWDYADEEWDYYTTWVQVSVYNMYHNRYEYDDLQNFTLIKRRVFKEH